MVTRSPGSIRVAGSGAPPAAATRYRGPKGPGAKMITPSYCAATNGLVDRALLLLDRSRTQCVRWRCVPALARVELARAEVLHRAGRPVAEVNAAAKAAISAAEALDMVGVVWDAEKFTC